MRACTSGPTLQWWVISLLTSSLKFFSVYRLCHVSIQERRHTKLSASADNSRFSSTGSPFMRRLNVLVILINAACTELHDSSSPCTLVWAFLPLIASDNDRLMAGIMTAFTEGHKSFPAFSFCLFFFLRVYSLKYHAGCSRRHRIDFRAIRHHNQLRKTWQPHTAPHVYQGCQMAPTNIARWPQNGVPK